MSAVTAMFIEEGLRRDEFVFIDLRDSAAGRQACVQGTSLAVWEIAWVARHFKNSVEQTAKHLRLPTLKVRSALAYAKCYRKEMTQAIEDFRNDNSLEALKRALPQVEVFPPRTK